MTQPLEPQWILDAAGVSRVADLCSKAGSFALDTEADSMHSYYHKVCLVQVTAQDEHFLIDVLDLPPADLEPLWDAVKSPDIEVLMHGADYDLRVLDRDYNVRFDGLNDTQIMAQILGEEKTGLAALLEKELGIKLDKRFQRADWGLRPLPIGCPEYAAADTAYLDALVTRLRARLEHLGRWSWAVEDCQRLMTVRFEAVTPDSSDFERIKGARKLKNHARDRIFTLYEWREKRAQDLDIPPFKILGPRQIFELAENPPADLDGISRISGLGPRFTGRYGRRILEILEKPQDAPIRRPFDRPKPVSAAEKQRTRKLLEMRDQVAAELAIEPSLLCTRAQAARIASLKVSPTTIDDLREAEFVGWRLEVLGEAFINLER